MSGFFTPNCSTFCFLSYLKLDLFIPGTCKDFLSPEINNCSHIHNLILKSISHTIMPMSVVLLLIPPKFFSSLSQVHDTDRLAWYFAPCFRSSDPKPLRRKFQKYKNYRKLYKNYRNEAKIEANSKQLSELTLMWVHQSVKSTELPSSKLSVWEKWPSKHGVLFCQLSWFWRQNRKKFETQT